MGLIDLITRALGRTPPRSSFEDNQPIGTPIGGGIQSYVSSWAWTGKSISPENAMEAPTVYACVRLISQTLARMPWLVLRRDADGTSNDPSHPVWALLNSEANEDMTSFTFREAQITDCLLYGNSFAFIQRNPAGTPVALERLRPDLMYMLRDPANQPFYQYWSGKADETASDEVKARKFRPYDILHVVGASSDGLLGEAAIHRMRDLIGLELELQEYTSRFFANNARPSGVLSMPGRLSPEAANRLREAWNRVHSGAKNSGKVAILEEGLKFESMSANAKDSDLDSMKQFARQQIAAAFNVPSHRVGDNDGVSYSSAEQANAVFVQSTLAGWAARLEQEINRKLLKRNDNVTTRISFDDLLRGDMSTRFSAYATAVTNGILTPNEIREREGLPAVEGGDMIRLPLNTSTPTAAASAAPALQDPASTPPPLAVEPKKEMVPEPEVKHVDPLEHAVELFYPAALAALTRCCEAEAKYLRSCRTPAKVEKWIPDHGRIASEIAPIMRGLLVLQGHADRNADGISIATAFAQTIKTEARTTDWHSKGFSETAVALATRLIHEIIQTNKEKQ